MKYCLKTLETSVNYLGRILMNLTTEQLWDAVLALPDGERVELVEALITSLQPKDRPPFDESCRGQGPTPYGFTPAGAGTTPTPLLSRRAYRSR